MPKKHMTTDGLAAMIERNIAHKEDIESLRRDMSEEFHAVHRDLHETEERLLNAIRGIGVRRQDFDALQANVDELARRLSALEKKR